MNSSKIEIASHYLDKNFEINVYGHFGISLLFFNSEPDSNGNPQSAQLIEKLKKHIIKGKIKIFELPGMYEELWWSKEFDPEAVSKRHYDYNNFLQEELIPSVYNHSGGAVPLISAGVSLGGYHAANTYFRRPDLFIGTIAIDGYFDLQEFTKGFFDENCYFNSPIHYLPNLNDNFWMSYLLSRKHVYLFSGSGENENPGRLTHFDEILSMKNIPHHTEIWDDKWGFNLETWYQMLEKVINTKL